MTAPMSGSHPFHGRAAADDCAQAALSHGTAQSSSVGDSCAPNDAGLPRSANHDAVDGLPAAAHR